MRGKIDGIRKLHSVLAGVMTFVGLESIVNDLVKEIKEDSMSFPEYKAVENVQEAPLPPLEMKVPGVDWVFEPFKGIPKSKGGKYRNLFTKTISSQFPTNDEIIDFISLLRKDIEYITSLEKSIYLIDNISFKKKIVEQSNKETDDENIFFPLPLNVPDSNVILICVNLSEKGVKELVRQRKM